MLKKDRSLQIIIQRFFFVLKCYYPSWSICFYIIVPFFTHYSSLCPWKAQEFSGSSSASVNLHAQATSFARLSETVSGKTHSLSSDSPVLPVSAEMAKLLPQRKGRVFIMKRLLLHTSLRKLWTWTLFLKPKLLLLPFAVFILNLVVAESARGSDLMLEAVLEAEVAHKAKSFFAEAEKETPALKGEAKQPR